MDKNLKYRCKDCNYMTFDKSNYNKHFRTNKHIKNVLKIDNINNYINNDNDNDNDNNDNDNNDNDNDNDNDNNNDNANDTNNIIIVDSYKCTKSTILNALGVEDVQIKKY